MKAKLPKNVVEALEKLRKDGYSNVVITNLFWRNDVREPGRTIQLYIQKNGEEGFNNLMRALLDGYEITLE